MLKLVLLYVFHSLSSATTVPDKGCPRLLDQSSFCHQEGRWLKAHERLIEKKVLDPHQSVLPLDPRFVEKMGRDIAVIEQARSELRPWVMGRLYETLISQIARTVALAEGKPYNPTVAQMIYLSFVEPAGLDLEGFRASAPHRVNQALFYEGNLPTLQQVGSLIKSIRPDHEDQIEWQLRTELMAGLRRLRFNLHRAFAFNYIKNFTYQRYGIVSHSSLTEKNPREALFAWNLPIAYSNHILPIQMHFKGLRFQENEEPFLLISTLGFDESELHRLNSRWLSALAVNGDIIGGAVHLNPIGQLTGDEPSTTPAETLLDLFERAETASNPNAVSE